jgi:hypothetical protein
MVIPCSRCRFPETLPILSYTEVTQSSALSQLPKSQPPPRLDHPSFYNDAPTSLAYASVLKDLGRSIGAPTARSMIS